MRYLFIILIFFSCTKDIGPEVEEAQSRGRKVQVRTSVQDAINSVDRGTIIIKKSYKGDVVMKDGINLHFEGGEVIGNIFSNDADFSITGNGTIVNYTPRKQTIFITDNSDVIIEGVTIIDTAFYKEAITNFGRLTINATVKAHGSATLNIGRLNVIGGYYYSLSDYTFWNIGGNQYLKPDSAKSTQNSVIGQYGGLNDSTFTLGGKYVSEGWSATEQGAGYFGGKNSHYISLHPNSVEGTAFYPHGGELAEFDNCEFTVVNAKSIDHQGGIHGLVRILSTCYANRPVADGLNIENKNLLIIQ